MMSLHRCADVGIGMYGFDDGDAQMKKGFNNICALDIAEQGIELSREILNAEGFNAELRVRVIITMCVLMMN